MIVLVLDIAFTVEKDMNVSFVSKMYNSKYMPIY